MKALARKFLLTVACLLAGTVSTSALAQMGGKGPGPFGESSGLHPLMVLLRTANLTADQEQRLHQLMKAHRADIEPLLTQLRSVREQIADKIASTGTVTTADLASLAGQLSQLQEQIQQKGLQTALQARALLTSEQLNHIAQAHAKLENLRSEIESILGPRGDQPPPSPGE